MDDEKFKALKANLTPLQEQVIMLLHREGVMVSPEDVAIMLGVPVLHTTYAMLVLETLGLVE